jgi:hypothetical protein
VCALVGAGLGIFNFVQGWFQRRVRLKVIPRIFSVERGAFRYSTNELLPRGLPCIEVVNFSDFPVTVQDVGFTLKGTEMRAALLDSKLPHRLNSRESVILYPKEQASIPRNIKKAYAVTECHETRYGDSQALKKLRESMK